MATPSYALADYQKAVEGNEVVKGKLYPKAGKFQITAQVGGILNQSYLSTILLPIAVTYHINEWHAVNAEFVYGMSKEQDARSCVENFFFDPARAKSASGGASGDCNPNPPPPREIPTDPEKGEKPPYQRKPAYPSIRQIDQMFGVNYQWTPVYGKALWFLALVGYLDVYANAGVGFASTTYWAMKDRNVNVDLVRDEGVDDAARNQWGAAGRPKATSDTAPTLSLGIGSRFYFAKMFTFNMDLRNTSLIGSDGSGGSEFMNFFTIWGGLGVLL
jgi:outer membrane beta-barrel protein